MGAGAFGYVSVFENIGNLWRFNLALAQAANQGIADIPVCDNGFFDTDRNVCDTLMCQCQAKTLIE